MFGFVSSAACALVSRFPENERDTETERQSVPLSVATFGATLHMGICVCSGVSHTSLSSCLWRKTKWFFCRYWGTNRDGRQTHPLWMERHFSSAVGCFRPSLLESSSTHEIAHTVTELHLRINSKKGASADLLINRNSKKSHSQDLEQSFT